MAQNGKNHIVVKCVLRSSSNCQKEKSLYKTSILILDSMEGILSVTFHNDLQKLTVSIYFKQISQWINKLEQLPFGKPCARLPRKKERV